MPSLNNALKINITEKQKIIDAIIAENISLRKTLEKCSAFIHMVHNKADIHLANYDLLDEIEDHFSSPEGVPNDK